MGQRLDPESFGGDSETSPCAVLSKEGENSSKPELSHVHSTALWPQGLNCTANKPTSKYFDDSASSLSEPVSVQNQLQAQI